jgi:hypothetical protein
VVVPERVPRGLNSLQISPLWHWTCSPAAIYQPRREPWSVLREPCSSKEVPCSDEPRERSPCLRSLS